MGILLFLVLGLIAGWLASVIMKTDAQQGPLWDIILGIVGALFGGFLFNLFGVTGVTGFNIYSILVATAGAVILIAVGRYFNRV